MNITYILSEFSGFERILKEKKWIPTGVPTIHKIIEHTNKNNNTNIIIMSNKNSLLEINELRNKVILVKNNFKSLLRPVMFIVNTTKILFILKKQKPDILYVDRANLFYASVFCRIFKYKVVLRLMGIYPDMISLEKRYNINSILQKFCYKTKFNSIICTQDGSPGDYWLKKYSSKKTPKFLLLGGYDLDQKIKIKKKIRNKTLNILFVGRLERFKGCVEFVDTAITLSKKFPKNFKFIIIGKGSLENILKRKINNKNLEKNFFFYKNIIHKELYKIYNKTDVYVSLNKLGSLSNSNIEAFSFCKCSIILKSDKKKRIDISTDKIIPKNFLIRIPREDIVKNLKNQLIEISNKKKIIEFYEKNMKINVDKLFLTWEKRVEIEINILKDLI